MSSDLLRCWWLGRCGNPQVKTRKCYLCNDSFVYAKRILSSPGSFLYRKSILLHDATVDMFDYSVGRPCIQVSPLVYISAVPLMVSVGRRRRVAVWLSSCITAS